MFKESFLHFVWKYQYFNSSDIETDVGVQLQIIKAGQHNLAEGPDFKEAKVHLDGLEWNGSVEIHRKASDWYAHGHQTDPNYDNVILHVVWENDQEVLSRLGDKIPTLELKGLIRPGVIERYQRIISSKKNIPCQDSFKSIRPITKLGTLERALTLRLEEKSTNFLNLLSSNGRDWEAAVYQWVCGGFGFKTNASPFLELASGLSHKILKKHSSNLVELESLLFGHAGLLPATPVDEYVNQLRKNYLFFRTKYDLPKPLPRNAWTFGRVRPSNYPTTRLGQLGALITNHPSLFSLFAEPQHLDYSTFQVQQSSYWVTHYDVGKRAKRIIGRLSKAASENLIMNVSVPVLVALWRDRDDERYLNKAQELLMNIKAENNHIIDHWKSIGWNVSNAYDSQGLIHLFNNFCKAKNCVNCGIGVELIGTRS